MRRPPDHVEDRRGAEDPDDGRFLVAPAGRITPPVDPDLYLGNRRDGTALFGHSFAGTPRTPARQRVTGGDRHLQPPTRPKPATSNTAREASTLLSQPHAEWQSTAPSSPMPAAILESLVEMWTEILCADYAERHPKCRDSDGTDDARLPLSRATSQSARNQITPRLHRGQS